jgi:hypothetical protein
LARTNYSFKKRQKELERQKKQEEKRQRRMAKKEAKLESESVQPDETEPLAVEEERPHDEKVPDTP